MRKKLFISYAHQDESKAMAICTALEKRGLNCWIACRDIGGGANFQDEIPDALSSAGAMLLVFSANANNSREIKKELALAGQYDMIVVPVRAENVTPSKGFAYELATRQWLDLFADWDVAMEKLVNLIERIIPADGAAPTSPPLDVLPDVSHAFTAVHAPEPPRIVPMAPTEPPSETIVSPNTAQLPIKKSVKSQWLLIVIVILISTVISALLPPVGALPLLGSLGYAVYYWGKSRGQAKV